MFIQCWGSGLVHCSGLSFACMYVANASQKRCWIFLCGDTFPSATSFTLRDQSFGFETILNLGAGVELPIRQTSISTPKNAMSSLVF